MRTIRRVGGLTAGSRSPRSAASASVVESETAPIVPSAHLLLIEPSVRSLTKAILAYCCWEGGGIPGVGFGFGFGRCFGVGGASGIGLGTGGSGI
jgi:hypothetical protein